MAFKLPKDVFSSGIHQTINKFNKMSHI